ncbi:DMT family transporter [Oceanobacillus senegalensis]|uniref:DMT family transporter n=1 Tax=Oceanobacillus senegalensis TaxID=1936063 RepID=UPI000A307D65|nr:DMT family transporter [Oceanobacillus senegalensis]
MYPYILMVLVVIIYAGNILVGKAINDLPPFTIAFFRLLVAFIALLPFGLKQAQEKWSLFPEYKKPILIMSLTGVTFFNTFIYGALQFTSATNVSVLESSIPVLTVILSAIILKEKLLKVQWIGVVLSFLGAIWVILDGKLLLLASTAWNIGDGIMIGAIVCWSIYSIYVKQYMQLFPSFGAPFIMTGISVLALLPFVAIEWITYGIPTFQIPSHILGLLFLGIFPSFIALVFYNRAVTLLGPSHASVFLNFLPVVTIIGAFLWLGETITLLQIIGSAFVIFGVMLTTQFGQEQKKKNERKQDDKLSV